MPRISRTCWQIADRLGCPIDLAVGREDIDAPEPEVFRSRLVGEAGPLLVDVRVQYLMDAERAEGIDHKIFRTAFWDGFFNYCSDRPDFVEAYGDQSNQYENSGWNISFSLGLRGANALAYYVRRDAWVGASFWTADFSLYERLLARKAEIDELLGYDGGRGCLERRKREVPRAAREAAGQPGARLLGRALSLDRRQTAGHPQDRGVAAAVRWAAKWRSARCEMRAYSDTPAASSSRCSSAVISQSTFSSSDESDQWVM